MLRNTCLAGLFAILTGAAHQGVPAAGQPPPVKPHAVLVELFTSEGCSSCPPADTLLRQIDGTQIGNETLVVGISEHVTYWDHDGWTDPFGSDSITDRQKEYGEKFHLPEIYTPQIVINGETQFAGGDLAALTQAVNKAATPNTIAIQIAKVTVAGDNVEAGVSIVGEIPKHGADIFAVVAEDETTAHVLRGENKGKTLEHGSVARVMVKAGKVKVAGDSMVRLKLPNEPAGSPGTKRHLVVWAQEPDLGRVVGLDSQTF
jgi:hypothetical protein